MSTVATNVVLNKIVNDPRYLRNVSYGAPRRGHAEGTVAAHILQLEDNLRALDGFGLITDDQYDRLEILIHVHDSFKMDAKRNAAIEETHSHASLARAFLAEFTDDDDLLQIVQYHDLGYAVWRKFEDKGKLDPTRLQAGLSTISDLNLFLTFAIIDSCTPSKGRRMIQWLVEYVGANYPGITVTTEIIGRLPQPDVACECF